MRIVLCRNEYYSLTSFVALLELNSSVTPSDSYLTGKQLVMSVPFMSFIVSPLGSCEVWKHRSFFKWLYCCLSYVRYYKTLRAEFSLGVQFVFYIFLKVLFK